MDGRMDRTRSPISRAGAERTVEWAASQVRGTIRTELSVKRDLKMGLWREARGGSRCGMVGAKGREGIFKGERPEERGGQRQPPWGTPHILRDPQCRR